MNPLVSIVLPYYNGSEFIKETLLSVFEQTYQNYELLLIDDGSPIPKESEFVQQVLSDLNDPRFIYLKKNNGGLSDARNFGLSKAQGDYIAFLDQDDLWHEKKLEKQVKVLELNQEIGLVFCDVLCLHKDGSKILRKQSERISKFKNAKIANPFELMLRENFVPCPSVFFRKEIAIKAGNSNKNFTVCPDYELFVKMSKITQFYYLNEPFLIYRIHDNNTSNQTIKLFGEVLQILFINKTVTLKEKINASVHFFQIIKSLCIYWLSKIYRSKI